MEKQLSLIDKINAGVKYAIAKAIADHKKAGRRIAVWSKEENKVKLIPASEIPDQNCNLEK